MEFGIIHLYNEPGIKFEISHKVDEFIYKEIDQLFKLYSLDKFKSDFYFNIYITTKSSYTSLEVRGAREIEDFIEYTIYFPYKQIVEAENMLEVYLDFFFRGVNYHAC